VSGIACGAFTDELLPLTRTNGNFDSCGVSVGKQGGPSISIAIPGPGGASLHSTSRVGDPGTRCGVVTGTQLIGTLTAFDLRHQPHDGGLAGEDLQRFAADLNPWTPPVRPPHRARRRNGHGRGVPEDDPAARRDGHSHPG
jgi:hypothetical protein